MSFQDGWAALNLEMPSRVPRTEYSAEQHWDLLAAVTGQPLSLESSEGEKREAQRVFWGSDGWHYDLMWATLVGGHIFGDQSTKMGHAEYAAGGVDRSDEIHCPYQEPEDVLNFDFQARFGKADKALWRSKFEDHYRRQCEECPDCVNMSGVYVTLMSGFIDLFGWDMLLLAAGIDAEAFGALANRYAAWMQPYFEALAEADVPVVMVHDDIVWTGGAFIRPAWYRAYIFPNYAKYLRPLLDSGKRILYTSDGDFTRFIDDIAACGVHGFVMEPMTDMAYIAERYGKTHVFVGNADTRVLLFGSKRDIYREVERCMAIGKSCPGFFMAVGNHIPPNTPVESALYYNEIYEKLSKR